MARYKAPPGINVEALRASLEKGEISTGYVLAGAETFFRFEALKALRETLLPEDAAGTGYIEFEGETEPRELFGALRTRGLFAEARMAVVDPAEPFVTSNGDALARYLENPPEGACLVLVLEKWEPKGALKKTAGALTVVSCNKLRGKAVHSWVNRRVRSYGKRLDRGVADLMVEIAGTDLSVLDRHLENLAAYVGERPNITPEDVNDIVGGDPQRATWELTAAVVKADVRAALVILEQMVRQGVAPLRIINGLAFEVSRLWQVKRLIRDGASEDEMLKAIGYGYRNRLFHIRREAQQLHPRRLLSAHRTLLESDLAVKTSSMPDDLLLECLVIKLCNEPTG